MLDVRIIRITEDTQYIPTCGVLLIDGIPFCVTLERPWDSNKNYVSCIPEGTYICKLVENVKLPSGKIIPKTFRLTNVPGRDGILLHSGVTIADSSGCILVGAGFTRHDSYSVSISHSITTKDNLVRELGVDTFDLKISRNYN